MKRILFVLIMVLLFGCQQKATDEITGQVVRDTTEKPMATSCLDSDGGLTPETYGTVTGVIDDKEFKKVDRCLSGLLVEYYCDGTEAVNQNVRCEGSCINGECV